MRGPPDRFVLGAFLGAVAIGGSNYVAVRFSNRELDPLWGAGSRFAIAAAVFGLLCAGLRLPLPRGRALLLACLYGLFGFGIAYGCMYSALQEVPAGLAAVVFAVGPLLVLLLAVAHGLERLSVRAVAGAVIAFAGSAIAFVDPGGISLGWSSFFLLGVAALAASESVVISKLAGRVHPMPMNFVGMGVGAAILLTASVAAGERLALPREGETQVAVAYLLAATVGLFLAVLYVVRRWTASATAYTFVLMPVVAIVMGALLAEEPVGPTTLVGGVIVATGVYVGALSGQPRRDHEAAPAPAHD